VLLSIYQLIFNPSIYYKIKQNK